MKIYMEKSYRVFESYGPIEINIEEYPELQGKSEEEIIEYLNTKMYEENIPGGYEDNLHDEFLFNSEIIKEKTMDEEDTIKKY